MGWHHHTPLSEMILLSLLPILLDCERSSFTHKMCPVSRVVSTVIWSNTFGSTRHTEPRDEVFKLQCQTTPSPSMTYESNNYFNIYATRAFELMPGLG